MTDPALLFVFDALAAIPVAGVGWFVGQRGRARDIAAARARQTEAETALEHAVKARLKAEGDLAPLDERLHRTDAALSASGAECERLRDQNVRLEWERSEANVARRRADRDARIVLDALAASYVRVGPAFKRWRADGDYTAPCGTQTGLEGCQTGVTASGTDLPVQEITAAQSQEIGFTVTTPSGHPVRIPPLSDPGWVELPAGRWPTLAASIPVHAIGDDAPGIQQGEV